MKRERIDNVLGWLATAGADILRGDVKGAGLREDIPAFLAWIEDHREDLEFIDQWEARQAEEAKEDE